MWDFISKQIIELLMLIDSAIYKLISNLYGLYLQIANARIFTDKTIMEFTERIYIVIGLVALFLITYALLQAVVDPDKNKETGITIVKRLVLALVLVPLLPTFFNFLYDFQTALISNNVINNFILGKPNDDQNIATYVTLEAEGSTKDNPLFHLVYADGCELSSDLSTECRYTTETYTEEALASLNPNSDLYIKNGTEFDFEIKRQQMAGNYMALSVFSAFYTPSMGNSDQDVIAKTEGYISEDQMAKNAFLGCALGVAGAAVAYIAIPLTLGFSLSAALPFTAAAVAACGTNALIAYNVTNAANTVDNVLFTDKYTLAQAKNQILADGDFSVIVPFSEAIVEGSMDYMPIISTIAGAFLLYMIFSFTLDLAVRAAKLAFYQLIAPIPIFLSVAPNKSDLLTNWIKLVLATYFEVFVRILVMGGTVYFLASINTSFDGIGELGLIAKAIVVLGLVTFAKQFPKLLGEVTGIKGDGLKLGIKEKLAEGGAFIGAAAVGGTVGTAVRNWNKTEGNKAKKLGSAIAGGLSGGIRSGYNARDAKTYKALAESTTKGIKGAEDKKYKRAETKLRRQNTHTTRFHDWEKKLKSAVGLVPDLKSYEVKFSHIDEYNKKMDEIKSNVTVVAKDAGIKKNINIAKAAGSNISIGELDEAMKLIEDKGMAAAQNVKLEKLFDFTSGELKAKLGTEYQNFSAQNNGIPKDEMEYIKYKSIMKQAYDLVNKKTEENLFNSMVRKDAVSYLDTTYGVKIEGGGSKAIAANTNEIATSAVEMIKDRQILHSSIRASQLEKNPLAPTYTTNQILQDYETTQDDLGKMLKQTGDGYSDVKIQLTSEKEALKRQSGVDENN